MNKLLQNHFLKTAEPSNCGSNVKGIARRLGRATLVAALFAAPGLVHATDVEQIVSTTCAVCHGADGSSVAPMYPNLAGQHRLYIKKQLTDFIDGRRTNDVMAPSIAALKPEDIDAIAAYWSTKTNVGAKTNSVPGDAEFAQLVEAGKTFFKNGNPETGVPGCTSCHKEDGSGDKRYPRLVGQNSTYITKQLADFKTGVRANDKYHLMRAVVTRMTEQEIKAVAEYLAVAGW